MVPTSPESTDRSQHYSGDVPPWTDILPFRNGSPRQRISYWGVWTVGSYIHVLCPTQSFPGSPRDGQIWQNHPALLVDICKQESGEIEFAVLYLYSRRAAAQRLPGLSRYARYRATVSLWSWPRDCTYILSNHLETVYEWDLSVWDRSKPPSVGMRWAFDTHINRVVRCNTWLFSSVSRALSMEPRFQYFLRLPREIRDHIYDFILLDEHQKTMESRVLVYNLPPQCGRPRSGDQTNYSSLMVSTTNCVPNFSTSSIFQVCHQIRSESLDALYRSYRSKNLVVKVTSTEERLGHLDRMWLPDISRFPRVRFDVTMSSGTPETMFDCFCLLAILLMKRQHLSLQRLEIRLGYSYANASAAVRDHGLALMIQEKDVLQSMRQLVPILQICQGQPSRGQHMEYIWADIGWGVSEEQIKAREFDCDCSYLSANFLDQVWGRACGRLKSTNADVHVGISEQDCRHFGCIYHRE